MEIRMSRFAIYETEVGFFRIAHDQNKVILLERVQEPKIPSLGVPTELTNQVYRQLVEYFKGNRKVFDFPYEMRGTDFQKKVWGALCNIPYGETCTYKEIAERIGNQKASRAVGMANHKNPLGIVVPCHRVIGANGQLVGYAGGLPMKKWLLELEEQNK